MVLNNLLNDAQYTNSPTVAVPTTNLVQCCLTWVEIIGSENNRIQVNYTIFNEEYM